jgi:hypothetical protein
MQYVVVFLGIVGCLSGLISIYKFAHSFPHTPRRRNSIFGIIMAGIIITTIIIVNVVSTLSNKITDNTNITSMALSTATAGVIQTAIAGIPAYQDPLNDPNNSDTKYAGWNGVQGNDQHCIFDRDGYHVYSNPNQPAFCTESGESFQDSAISVDMVLVHGTGGLLFRIPPKNTSDKCCYFFEVSAGGSYNFSLPSTSGTGAITGFNRSPAIHKSYGASNTLQVIAKESNFSLYINGSFLISVRDSTLMQGTLGFAIYSHDSSNGEAIFSNLHVYT